MKLPSSSAQSHTANLFNHIFLFCYSEISHEMRRWYVELSGSHACTIEDGLLIFLTIADMFLNIPNLIHVLLGGTVPIYRASVRAYDSVTVNATDPANRLTMSNDLLIGARFCHSQPIRDKRSKWCVI